MRAVAGDEEPNVRQLFAEKLQLGRVRRADHGPDRARTLAAPRRDGVELEGRFTRGESKGYDAHALLVFVVDTNEPAGCITEFGLHDATFHGICERGRLD